MWSIYMASRISLKQHPAMRFTFQNNCSAQAALAEAGANVSAAFAARAAGGGSCCLGAGGGGRAATRGTLIVLKIKLFSSVRCPHTSNLIRGGLVSSLVPNRRFADPEIHPVPPFLGIRTHFSFLVARTGGTGWRSCCFCRFHWPFRRQLTKTQAHTSRLRSSTDRQHF